MKRYLVKFGIYLLLPGVVGLGVPGCALTEPEEEEIEQEVLFEFQYINHAWGYQHSGSYIDGEGKVTSYQYTASDTHWAPADLNHPTEEELQDKYSHSPQEVKVIDPDTLIAKYGLIEEAAAGTYSDSLSLGADMGAYAYICYVYQPDTDRYDAVVLRLWGDWCYENLSPAAGKLAQWLEEELSPSP
ncbi:MAG: hypothetical protein JSU77_02190 [Fidelibacterota bacterium]|nr:MAG: hypothetical protein JSU77_02190 [Candidatus Neomarinimicrobiota bacterium]